MIDVASQNSLLNGKVQTPSVSTTNFSGNIVLVSGKDDVISDGTSTIIVSNGDPLLGKITGVHIVCVSAYYLVWLLSWVSSGCLLGCGPFQ
jgi:hydroxyethylthiazole kinase-like sugar kinase family protein